ncbi:MAG: glycosyltransferase family 2 protein [Burkholderiales bacterium]
MPDKPSTLIIIVNYQTAGLVIECLKSLEPEVAKDSAAKVMVVDNSSQDGSADHISGAIKQGGWASWARLIRSEINGGFSYGNNVAIRRALSSPKPPDHYWLLNPDTRVHPGALASLTDFLCNAPPQVGIVGSSLEEANGQEWPWAFRFPGLLSELEAGLRWGLSTRLLENWRVPRRMNTQPQQVDWLPGASMMIRRDVFRTIGLMDESYFLYFEETDFCLQARRAGWQCWYVPQSRVLHIAGQSTGVTTPLEQPRRLPAYWFESRRRYFIKNHGRLYAMIADIVWMVAFASWRTRRRVLRRPDPDPPRYLLDFFRYSSLWHSRIEVGVARTRQITARSAKAPSFSPNQ